MIKECSYLIKSVIINIKPQDEYDIDRSEKRFVICDQHGNIIDDAQGYGYKTEQSAHKAAAFKSKGNKQKINKEKTEAKKFWKENSEFSNKLNDFIILNAKIKLTNKDFIAFASEHGIPNFNPNHIKYFEIDY